MWRLLKNVCYVSIYRLGIYVFVGGNNKGENILSSVSSAGVDVLITIIKNKKKTQRGGENPK